jgi:hypothetical protein
MQVHILSFSSTYYLDHIHTHKEREPGGGGRRHTNNIFGVFGNEYTLKTADTTKNKC